MPSNRLGHIGMTAEQRRGTATAAANAATAALVLWGAIGAGRIGGAGGDKACEPDNGESHRFCLLNSPTSCTGIWHEMANSGLTIDAEYEAKPSAFDTDGDGDPDLYVGSDGGHIQYFENTGNATDPVFVNRIGSENPLDGIYMGKLPSPVLVDIDDDGDADLYVATECPPANSGSSSDYNCDANSGSSSDSNSATYEMKFCTQDNTPVYARVSRFFFFRFFFFFFFFSLFRLTSSSPLPHTTTTISVQDNARQTLQCLDLAEETALTKNRTRVKNRHGLQATCHTWLYAREANTTRFTTRHQGVPAQATM